MIVMPLSSGDVKFVEPLMHLDASASMLPRPKESIAPS